MLENLENTLELAGVTFSSERAREQLVRKLAAIFSKIFWGQTETLEVHSLDLCGAKNVCWKL